MAAALRTVTWVVVEPAPEPGPLPAPWSELPAAMGAALTRAVQPGATCEAAGCHRPLGPYGVVTLVTATNTWGAAVAVCPTCSPASLYATGKDT